MEYSIYAEYDVEVIKVSEDVKLYSLWSYIGDNVNVQFFISLGKIEQAIPRNFYMNVKAQNYELLHGKMFKAMRADGSDEFIWELEPAE